MSASFDNQHFLNECYAVLKARYPKSRPIIHDAVLSFVFRNPIGFANCTGRVTEFDGKMWLSMRAFYGEVTHTILTDPAELETLIEKLYEELVGPRNVTREEYFGDPEA